MASNRRQRRRRQFETVSSGNRANFQCVCRMDLFRIRKCQAYFSSGENIGIHATRVIIARMARQYRSAGTKTKAAMMMHRKMENERKRKEEKKIEHPL